MLCFIYVFPAFIYLAVIKQQQYDWDKKYSEDSDKVDKKLEKENNIAVIVFFIIAFICIFLIGIFC